MSCRPAAAGGEPQVPEDTYHRMTADRRWHLSRDTWVIHPERAANTDRANLRANPRLTVREEHGRDLGRGTLAVT